MFKLRFVNLKQINSKRVVEILVGVLFLAQPIFDIIKNSVIHDIQIFGFSFFAIFNIILVCILAFLAVFLGDSRKKMFRFSLLGFLFLIYFGLHCYNMTLFNNDVYPQHSLNFLTEFYYLYKTFVNPIILILSLYYLEVKRDYLIKLVQIFSLIISVVIIISNIFHFGYLSYGDDNVRCVKSIFSWFTFKNVYKYSFYEIACRGLFFSANQLSSVTFMIFPIILYSTYKRRRPFDYVCLICLIISMYMLGTKVSTLGVIAAFMLFFSLYAFFLVYNKVLKKKEKLKNILGITFVFAGSVALFFFSPRFYEMKFLGEDFSSIQLIEDSLEGEELDVNQFNREWKKIKKIDCYQMTDNQNTQFLSFFRTYSGYMGVSKFIIDSYDYNRYPEFWCNYLQTSRNNDYRVLKTAILDKIYTDNDNKLDKYFGLGYNLGFIYTESDYSFQFYSYGIIGCILFLSGYFISCIVSAYRILKNWKKQFKFENILLLSSPAIALFTAQFSGHVLERTIPLMVLAVVSSITLINSKGIN